QRAVAGWRETPGRRGCQPQAPATAPGGLRPRPRPLSPRQALWLLLRPGEDLTAEEDALRRRLLAGPPDIRAALTLIEGFRQMLRTRDHAALDPWLRAAETGMVPEIRAF